MKHHIFLSYRRADRKIAQALVTALEAKGLDVWWDDEIEGGADWRDDIVEQLTNSDMLVVLFSEECNNSKQLKKELAVADSMDKNIIPVLIEDTKPKGHYLYELASRNWIQIHPEAMTKIDRLVEKLVAIGGQIPSRLELGPQSAQAVQEPSHAALPVVEQSIPALAIEQSATVPIAPAAPPQVVASPLVPPPLPSIAPPILNEQGAKPAPDQKMPFKEENAKKKEEDTKALRDFLPFQRGDWMPLSLIGLIAALMTWGGGAHGVGVGFGLLYVMVLIYGVVVFPVRYYQRHLRPTRVARMLFLSNLVLFIPSGFLMYSEFYDASREPDVAYFIGELFGIAFFFVIVVGISFSIYAIACGQRALRSFRSNVEKL